MKDLYNKIEKYFQFEKADTVFVTLFKSLLLLICGGYFGLILREINADPQVISYKHIAFLILGLSTFIYIEYRRLKKEKNFPVTILEHLNATEELKDLKEKHSRKTKLYDFIDNSIQSLNSNTCPVVLTPDNFLCHQDLELGLKSVLIDLVDRPHYILDVDQTKFTVGTFIKDILDKNSQVGEISSVEKTFIFRDDLNIAYVLPESPYQLNSEQEGSFQFQTALLEGLNFNKFLCKSIKLNDQSYTLICSPIPNVCEDCPPDGIVFSLFKGTECCSSDIDSVLLIFGRILSNWIAKYNDCVRRDKRMNLDALHSHKKAEVPPEVLELLEKQQKDSSKQ
jgi:hypothetical protein